MATIKPILTEKDLINLKAGQFLVIEYHETNDPNKIKKEVTEIGLNKLIDEEIVLKPLKKNRYFTYKGYLNNRLGISFMGVLNLMNQKNIIFLQVSYQY